MSEQPRNETDYGRRMARGAARGLSRSQARGHPKAGETPLRPKATNSAREQAALKDMKRGVGLTEAARFRRISPERLRRYLRENTKASYAGLKWKIEDRRSFRFPFYSRGRVTKAWLSSVEASNAGSYMAVVKKALREGEPWLLFPFQGEGATDLSGKFHPFETDLNTLYGLDLAGEASIPETYRIQGAPSHG